VNGQSNETNVFKVILMTISLDYVKLLAINVFMLSLFH